MYDKSKLVDIDSIQGSLLSVVMMQRRRNHINEVIGQGMIIGAAVTGSQEAMRKGIEMVTDANLPTAKDQKRKSEEEALEQVANSGPLVVRKIGMGQGLSRHSARSGLSGTKTIRGVLGKRNV